MTLKTGMLVGIVGSEDIGVLIQVRSASNTCVIKLNNGTLKKNVPLEDVEEAKDMTDTKEKKSPIRLGGAAESPGKSPPKLATLSSSRSTHRIKTALEVGGSVRARSNGGSRWFPGKILRVNRDGTFDVEYSDGDIEKKMAASDVEAASMLEKSPLRASPPRKNLENSSFAVGDKVKARYKNGAKLFSGKIARVRSDGTYDITYDDGDAETRVPKDRVEANTEVLARKKDSDDEAPKKKSGRFTLNQSVKARYKGGKKLFPGKIKRMHSDGTYDILYEDGDEEKRVKAESIETTADPNADSDDDRKLSKTSANRAKALTVGKKVKARYKKGKRLFPGKISRVRSDGTYDIDYDDGETETCVEASQIEDSDDADMFADSDDDKKRSTAGKKKGSSWEVNDHVKAFYGKGTRLFPGKIAKVHMNGTYDVKYDDGDSELRVDASLIEDADADAVGKDKPASITPPASPRMSSTSSSKRPLRVGDSVKAKYKRGTRFFPGKVTRERMDGTFDIKYEDGDVEERVEVDFIQRKNDGDEDNEKEKKKKISFEVGDVVKAPFQRSTKLFRGKISRVRSDGTYDIAFDDGDGDTRVPGELIQPEKEEQNSRDDKPKKATLKVGDTVMARYKKGKRLFSGTVTRARSDGTYDIKYDDGDVEMRVYMEMIEVPDSKNADDDGRAGSPKAKKTLKVGDKVRARYNKGSNVFSGEIAAVHRDGTYDVRYDDGDKEKHVEAKDIELEKDEKESQSPKRSSSVLKVGDAVEASYKTGIKMFPGKISRVHSDGTYDIKFNDGDSERRIPKSRIKPKGDKHDSPKKKKTGFTFGDAVKAKNKKGTKYFEGKIARVRSDGTYDIEYDDGDLETHVDEILIVSTEPEVSKASERSPKPSVKAKRFEVGNVIKARYKKGTKLFPGKITRVRSDGTYDVRYDDGDTEMHVESSFIEGEEKSKPRDKADDKKPEGFAVGDKVNAKYKGGLRMYPGKIVKTRMDGTFDVEFDDGDLELRVSSSSMELIPGSKKTKLEAKASSDKEDIFGESDSDGKNKRRGEKKNASVKVGDVVEANFKLKGKFHRGKIVRARSDGTFDIEYDVGASEKHVRLENIKMVGGNQDDSGGEENITKKKKTKPAAGDQSSDSDRPPTKTKAQTNSKKPKRPSFSSSECSESDRKQLAPIEKGARVTYRKAEDAKTRRVGIVRKVHFDGSYDVKYSAGDTTKRVARELLIECSDSEDSDGGSTSKVYLKRQRGKEGPTFRRHERVLSNWRRSSRLSKPRMTDKWTKATVLEKNADGTFTVRYNDGVVEEDVPSEALKASKKQKSGDSDSDGNSMKNDASGRRRKRKLKCDRTNGIGKESLFLLEQLAMTLFEEGILKKKPKLQLLRESINSDSSESSSSSSTESESSTSCMKKTGIDKVLKRLFDSSSLQTYRQMFKDNDMKGSGKVSRSRIIALVEDFIAASKPAKDSGRVHQTSYKTEDDGNPVSHILTEWFATHDDLRTHRHFEFKTLMIAFAFAKCRLGKLRMEQSVAAALEGRFASYHENKRQLELWQQKLGYRLFETLQRHFHDHALSNLIPSRIRVSELSLIFEQVARQAIPNKPLDVYLQQHQLFPHHTLLLPEFMCCYYQLYGSEHSTTSRWSGAVELRPVAFVASCLFSNGDNVCKRHGDLMRRLSVGRTQAQADLILRFRESFEVLLSTDADSGNSHQEQLLETSQLSTFAAKVAPDPTLLEPAMTLLRKRSAAVSLVEIYGSCGFIIDELTSAPTIRNAIEKMRMRVDLADVRRIIGLVRNICVKILRFPNNADYWRIRSDSAAFQQKLGRYDGGTSLLEAVGFVEFQKTHYELRGARNMDGKRISALEKSTLDALREKCVQLDGELSLFDGVESISSILQRMSQAREREGSHFTLEECQATLKNLSSYIENVLKNPKDSRCWRIREANGTFQRQIGYLPYAMELMESIGFELTQTLHGNAYTLRGTGMTSSSKKSDPDAAPSASLSNFAFTSVSSQMEWFLWRRKQEIDSLLEDEMRYLHDIVGSFSHSQSAANSGKETGASPRKSDSNESHEATLVKRYPYGTNAVDTFNKTSIQRLQLDMMRCVFNRIDVDQKGFLAEADFIRAYGSPSTLSSWSRFDAFDIGKDDKIDFPDFVAALGPLVDHTYELTVDKSGEQVASSSGDDSNLTLCEATSLAVGGLRLGTSCAAAATALQTLLIHLSSIVQEPGNAALWSINNMMAIGGKLLRFPAGRELLHLVGFRECMNTPSDENSGAPTRYWELQPQRVRFKTTKTVSELPTTLDTATITRIQTIAAMLAGHYRGLKNRSVSDVSSVSRAISTSERSSESWSRVVQLAMKCLKNIESQPENPRYREISTATNTFTRVVGSVQGGIELLLSIGFRETDSGTLAIPSDSSLDEVKARRLELEVGLALLHLKLATIGYSESTTSPRKLAQSPRNEFVGQKHVSSGDLKNRTVRSKPHAQRTGAGAKQVYQAKRLIKKNTSVKQRPQSARSFNDPIEREILADFPHHKDANPCGNRAKASNRGRSTTSALPRKTATMGHDRASMSRKQVQRRSPNIPPSAGGHTMALAEDAGAGSEIIVVHKGQFVLRGSYIRIGAELPDLYEERMVLEVSSNHEHLSGVTKLRLGLPLRFFHPAKELVSTVLLPSTELARRLEISDTQTFVREIIGDIVDNIVDLALIDMASCQPKDKVEPQFTNLAMTVVTSFEAMATLPIVPSNLRVGPSMRYIAAWSDKSGSDDTSLGVAIFNDCLSDRKLQVYWEALVLQAGTSNKKVRLGDVKEVVRKNAYLSLLLSTARDEVTKKKKDKGTKTDDFQLTYEGFRGFIRLPASPKSGLMDRDEDENEARLQLPLAYLNKHFQVLMQSTTISANGFKSVKAFELLHRVYKDVQDHPPIVSDDPKENQAGMEITKAVCQQLERAFVGSQRTGHISWPELVYFVRHNKHLTTPEIISSVGSQLVLDAPMDMKQGSRCREVAEAVSGMHSSRLLILYFDGSLEVWSLSSSNTVLESKAVVLFSTKQNVKESEQAPSNKTFLQAWMDANQTEIPSSNPPDKQADRSSARIYQLKRSVGPYGALVRFCAWDSVLCVNSSILQEAGSGSFRFFRLATNFLSPIRQVALDRVQVEFSDETTSNSRKRIISAKKGGCAASTGIVKTFELTSDGSKIVYLSGADTIIWVACAGTGKILCHANMLASGVGKFRSLFQISEKCLPSGEVQALLYATTSAKSYRHVGMWILPRGTEVIQSFERRKVFSFGKANVATVVHLAVSSDLLFVASRDGSIIVWSTSTDVASPILPLVCLQIPLRNEELQSISCQSLSEAYSEVGTSMIQVGESTAVDIDRWGAEVLQRFETPPLRFVLYMFDDGEMIRLPIPDKFDVRLVTLDDPAFEFHTFLAPVSGVEHNRARRVTLHKHRITRVLLIALHHSQNGIFAQKSVQEFFQDLENHEVLWKARAEMEVFALSYQENVAVELWPFYRCGDSESVELTHPRYLAQRSSTTTQDSFPVLVVGATLKSSAGDRTQFQAWKFAMNWIKDDVGNKLEAGHGQLDQARRSLALQSSYCVEAERLVRIRKDSMREEHDELLKSRRIALIQGVKDNVRDVIAHDGRQDEAAENLLKAVNVLMLASFDAHGRPGPVETFLLQLLNRGLVSSNRAERSGQSRMEVASLVKLLQSEEDRSVCFGAYLNRIKQIIIAVGQIDGKKDIIWDRLSLEAHHIEACTGTTAEIGALFVDLGLADAFTSSVSSDRYLDDAFPPAASLPNLVQQLHRFLSSTEASSSKTVALESTMDMLLSSRAVVEFIIECINFSAFFKVKMADLWTRITGLVEVDNHGNGLEAGYVVNLQVSRWQQELRELAQTQNQLQIESMDYDHIAQLEPTVEDLQQLQRFLKTPLPCVFPILSSVTLETRCDTIRCRDRFVMNAIGRLECVGVEFIQLSAIYLFMEGGEEQEKMFQQELTFLRKVQHLSVREYFIPACIDMANVPILPAADALMVCAGNADDIHCIVAESLSGWNSLSDCIKFLRVSSFPMDSWKSLLWYWSRRVLMALLAMQNERFAMRKGIDLDMLLVSPNGSDLRVCSLSGGEFVRFGENNENADSLSQSIAKGFGFFVFELLLRAFSDENGDIDCDLNLCTSEAISSDSGDILCKMRNQVIGLLSKKIRGDIYDDRSNPTVFLSDFSSVSQIIACGVGTGEGEDLEKVCILALLALQPSSARPSLQSLWVHAGRPKMEMMSEEPVGLQTLSRHMMTIVDVQRPLQKLLQDLRVCYDECDDEGCDESILQRVSDNWITFLEHLFQLKPRAFGRDEKKDLTTDQIFVQTLGQILDSHVPHQLCTIALRIFTQCSKSGNRVQGREAIQTLLYNFANVFELIETNSNFDELQGNSLLMTMIQQILDCLQSVAGSQMPPSRLGDPIDSDLSTPSRLHRDVAANAVLWRLSEPLFRDLLAIEIPPSKYEVLLRWLESRRSPFGFTSTLLVGNEVESSGSGMLGTGKDQLVLKQELALWWSDHAPQTPRHTPSTTAEDEMMQKGYSSTDPMTANYLRCVYETKETEFKLTSGVSVPKFRLAALQQFFGPTFFERRRCFPMVFVRPLVATVWRVLAFDRLICSLLRDGDEKIVLGALSLLECSTRIFRFDALRSPRVGAAKDAASRNATIQISCLYSCPERAFALNLCSQSVVFEVKRVLEQTIRALKVLGESGTFSASRGQHPLIAILCVGMAWLANCLHGGDRATQFWGMAGIDQLIIAHCKANSLSFAKMRDSNMMNQVFRQGQRLAQQDPVTASKWQVFTCGSDVVVNHSSGSTRNCSPFRLMFEEIVLVGSNRAIGLMQTLLLSRTFREQVAATNDSTTEAFQRDLIASSDYGKVSHAIDLARDITQLNGTTNEQVQLILYTRALFVYHTATSSRVRVSVLALVCREVWGWVETAWRTIVSHSSGEKALTLSRAQGDVVMAGFLLLYSIISHPSLLIEDILELTTLDTGEGDEVVNVLHELVVWITNLPCGVTRRPGSTLTVLIESGVDLLMRSVQSRRYDEVALATVNTCVDVRALLQLLGMKSSLKKTSETTIVSIDEKQQLWSMLLYFDSRIVTTRILDMDFLDNVVLSWLLNLEMNVGSTEDQLNSINQRLEAALLLEVLIFTASRHEKSVNTHMLFTEACKLLLHHDIIAKEAKYLRKTTDSSGDTRKLVAVSKRVMQLVCCLCIDYSSNKTSQIFLEQLESVGIPAWVVTFHQAQQIKPDSSTKDQLLTRVELFWKDWQGHAEVRTKSTNCTMMLQPTRKSRPERTLVQTAPRMQRSVSDTSSQHPTRKKLSIQVETTDSDGELVEVKLERPLVSVSPVKVDESVSTFPQAKQTSARPNAAKKSPSVIQTLLSIDADSALRLVKKSTARKEVNRKQPSQSTEDEDLDSDAYSPFPGGSSSEEETRQRRSRAQHKARSKRGPSKEKKAGNSKEDESKLERDTTARGRTRASSGSSSNGGSPSSPSSPQPRRRAEVARKAARKRPKAALAPQTQDALRVIFRKYDVDGDGAISFIDLRRAMDRQTAGQDHRLSDLEIQRWISDKDRSGQGVVAFEDFARAFQRQVQQ